jgi:hypothetical protein
MVAHSRNARPDLGANKPVKVKPAHKRVEIRAAQK